MSTLIVNLDEKVKKAPRFKSKTLSEYFRSANLRWWLKLSQQPPYKEQEQAISAWLDNMTLGNVLELGPGFGRITKIIAEKSCEKLTLIEINKKAIKKLAKLFPSAVVVEEDICIHPWYHEQYDLIVAIEIAVHIQNIENLLTNFSNALVRCGKIIISITPTDWYTENHSRATVIHRGINRQEFEDALSKKFHLVDVYKNSNGQSITYLLQK